jgi:hypothetical protein
MGQEIDAGADRSPEPTWRCVSGEEGPAGAPPGAGAGRQRLAPWPDRFDVVERRQHAAADCRRTGFGAPERQELTRVVLPDVGDAPALSAHTHELQKFHQRPGGSAAETATRFERERIESATYADRADRVAHGGKRRTVHLVRIPQCGRPMTGTGLDRVGKPPELRTPSRLVDRFLLVISAATFIQSVVIGWRDRFQDFEIFYLSAAALRRGGDPYTSLAAQGVGPNTNHPAVMVLLQPLTYAPFPAATMLWLGAGLVALGLTVRAIAPAVLPTSRRALLMVIMVTQAAALTVRQGQVVFFVMALFTIAWLADRDERSGPAGLALGVLMALKPFYGVFALYLLWRRDWRALRGAMLGSAACLLVGLLARHGQAYVSWIDTLREINWQAHLTNVSIRGVAARWFAEPPHQPFVLTTTPLVVSTLAEHTLWIVGAAIVTFATARCLRRTDDRDHVWAILGLAALLLSPLAEVHYVIVGLGPIASLVMRSQRWRLAWLVGVPLSLPFALVNAIHASAFATATIGSVYALATAALWAALLPPPAVSSVTARTNL